MRPPLIITSMHRSGSSTITGLLQAAGLHIGTRLMQANPWNTRGYFENLAFYDFHRAALAAMRQNPNGYCLTSFNQLPEPWLSQARELLKQEGRDIPWGWKDPRSVLFLNFWRELCPGAGYIFLFRNPWCVVDSLYRRGDAVFRNQPELVLACWAYYNRKILDFYRTLPDRCLLAKAEWVFANPADFIAAVSGKLGIPLDEVEHTVIDPGLYHDEAELSFYAHMLKEHVPEAVALYQELLCTSDYALLGRTREEADNAIPLPVPGELKMHFFQDWCEKRELQRNYDELIATAGDNNPGSAGEDGTLTMMNEYGRELDNLLSDLKCNTEPPPGR